MPESKSPRARKRKSNAGRPSSITPAILAKLEQAFLMGCTDSEACLFADINPSTLYRYCERNPEFSERKEVLKGNPVMRARGVVLDHINQNDLGAAQELLKRKEGSKVAVTGANGGPLQVTEIKRTITD